MGTYRLTAHSFVAITLFAGLIVFTPGTQLSIYVLLIPVIKCSWLATAADIWNGFPTDLSLQGEASGWCTILKDVGHCVCT